LKLLKKVNINDITRASASRAVTVPAEVDKNNAAALNTIFLSVKGLSEKKNNKY
jgi:hypothetical protein